MADVCLFILHMCEEMELKGKCEEKLITESFFAIILSHVNLNLYLDFNDQLDTPTRLQ